MTISPGAVVTCAQTGSQAWVAKRQRPDGRWELVSKSTSPGGGELYHGRVVGEGDITVVTEAPSFTGGETVLRDGLELTVVVDLGAAVVFTMPQHYHECRRGGRLVLAAGNRTVIEKSDLVVEALQ